MDESNVYDPVNPPHYQRGPVIENRLYADDGPTRVLQCIEVMRCIQDPRLATALRYLWRVAWGGKIGEDPNEAIEKARWYLADFVAHPPQEAARGSESGIMVTDQKITPELAKQMENDWEKANYER